MREQRNIVCGKDLPRTSSSTSRRSRGWGLWLDGAGAPPDNQGPADIDRFLDGRVGAGSTDMIRDDGIARLNDLTCESRVEIAETEEVSKEQGAQKGVAKGKPVEVRNNADNSTQNDASEDDKLGPSDRSHGRVIIRFHPGVQGLGDGVLCTSVRLTCNGSCGKDSRNKICAGER